VYILGFNLLFLALSPLSRRGVQRKSARNFWEVPEVEIGRYGAVEFHRDSMMVKFRAVGVVFHQHFLVE